MTKGPSPLLGYNTNVRHKGRVFHIQTEDSGIAHPHVITHLFADGGRILKSNKTAYAELVGIPDMIAQVKKIMQDQHKAMFIALRDGQFDAQIDAMDSSGDPAHSAAMGGSLVAPLNMLPKEHMPQTGSAQRPASSTSAPASTPVSKPSTPAVTPTTAAPSPSAAVQRPSAPTSAPRQSGSVRPPSMSGAASGTNKSGHYTAVRAPEILGSFKNKPESNAPSSIFGDGLMSEKSLDEVILAYLAEDLEDEKS